MQLDKLCHPEPVAWQTSPGLTDYEEAVTFMERRAQAIYEGREPELVWLLEHPPLYTGGTSAKPDGLLNKELFPVYQSARGGEYTYHGPGQRVAYVMLDLTKRGRDIRAFVHGLEAWIINTLEAFAIKGERREGRVGVWVDRTRPGEPMKEDKIAAIGVRIRRWVSFHGIAINVEPTLSHFHGIVPCGIAAPGLGVTSFVDLGYPVTMNEVDLALQDQFTHIFGPS